MSRTITSLIVVLIGFLITRAAQSAHWSVDPAEGATVLLCAGQNLTLPWNISLDTGEQIIDIEWLFAGLSDQMVAMFFRNIFFPSPSYCQRSQHVPNAGLSLYHMTLGDAGNYTVEVKIDTGSGGFLTLRRTAFVHVTTVSSAQTDATLEAKLNPVAAYDNNTNEFRVQLTCSSHGRQPPAVIWTGPGRQEMTVSHNEGGKFSLLLPNPVSGGNYICRLPSDSPAAKCLPRDDPTLQGATVFVDKMDVNMMLMEAEIFTLKHKLATVSRRVVFYARLNARSTPVADGGRVIPEYTYVNEGGAYNAATGEFTAPYDGFYNFIATAGANEYSTNGDRRVILYLRVDGRDTASIWTKSVSFFEMGTCTTAIHLTVGQRVWLESRHGNYTYGTGYTTFSGFLISSD